MISKERQGQRRAQQARRPKKVKPRRDGPAASPGEDYSQYSPAPPRRYALVFYDTFPAARGDKERIHSLCSGCDQLNLVIRAEGDMDDRELLGIDAKVKIFAGAAWALIHERRLEEGWYEATH